MAVAILLAVVACTHSRPFIRGPQTVPAPHAALDHRLILIGDAGDADPAGERTLDLLEQRVRIAPAKTTVVFLGDNVYETGMPEPTALEGTATEAVLDKVLLTLFESRRDAERRLKAQVKAVRVPGARAIFVPGNHDWGGGQLTDGQKRLGEEQGYIDALRTSVAEIDLSMLPRDACPGPIGVDVGRRGRLIVLDTQWWLDAGTKPSPENPSGCLAVTDSAVRAALQVELEAAAAAGRRSVVVGHHPLESEGPHGGFVPAIEQVFPFRMAPGYVPYVLQWMPLPGLGSVAGWLRAGFSPSGQDFSGPGNARLRTMLTETMERAAAKGAPTLAYAAGHDHSLQVFRSQRGPRWSLVSGLGSRHKASGVSHDHSTVFAHSNAATPGFMEIDFLTNGSARLGVIEWSADRESGVEVYSTNLTSES